MDTVVTQATPAFPPAVWRIIVDEQPRSGAANMALDQALAEAREFNAAIDAEIQGAALKMAEARQAKNASLASLFEETQTPEKTEETRLIF